MARVASGRASRPSNQIWRGLQENRDQWITQDIKPAIKKEAKIAYFAGCTASFVEQDIAQSASKLLEAAGVEFTTLGKDEMCCGIPMLVAGKWDLFAAALRHNSAAMQARGVEEVVTSCPACWLVWNRCCASTISMAPRPPVTF
jgi:Fe-S oxidoreductase